MSELGETILPSLSVRKIDDDVYKRLSIRAAEHGVSMEEEVRQILRRAVAAPERLGDLALEYFGANGVELELPSREPHQPY
jgi:plasmid stability protein